eukprot:902012-Pelagomonas_calceolata.AAC.9
MALQRVLGCLVGVQGINNSREVRCVHGATQGIEASDLDRAKGKPQQRHVTHITHVTLMSMQRTCAVVHDGEMAPLPAGNHRVVALIYTLQAAVHPDQRALQSMAMAVQMGGQVDMKFALCTHQPALSGAGKAWQRSCRDV